jgi:hypothetical protein
MFCCCLNKKNGAARFLAVREHVPLQQQQQDKRCGNNQPQ